MVQPFTWNRLLIQQVLVCHNEQYKDKGLEKLAFANGLCPDPDDNSNSVYSNATDPYHLPTEAEFFKLFNKILGTNTIWDFALQRSWFN